MNREQKAATIEALAAEIDGSDAVFAVDYRGISVSQAAELRTKLREVDATFQVVKNSLTERAADQVGAELLKPLLSGPTALTFVRGDAAMAAKAIADQARVTQLLPFKGGLMDGDVLDAEQIRAISRLPSREALYGQLVGIVASPISGLVRTLGALVGGLAVALGQVREKKESGEIPAGEPPAAQAAPIEEEPSAEAPVSEGELQVEEALAEPSASEEEPQVEEAPAEPSASEEELQVEEAPAEPSAPEEESQAEEPPVEPSAPEEESQAEEPPAEPSAPEEESRAEEPPVEPSASAEQPKAEEAPAEQAPAEQAATDDQAEPASDEPAQDDDNQADASAQETDSAEATKED